MEVLWGKQTDPQLVKLGQVKYGEVIELPGQRHILIKVDKRKSSKHNNMEINWTNGHCLCLNPKHGTIRALPGEIEVRVLDAAMYVNLLEHASDVQDHLKY